MSNRRQKAFRDAGKRIEALETAAGIPHPPEKPERYEVPDLFFAESETGRVAVNANDLTEMTMPDVLAVAG